MTERGRRGKTRMMSASDNEQISRYLKYFRDAIIQTKPCPFYLYHYTSLENLPKFFDDGSDILATHSATLNDTSEIMTGFSLFCNELKEVCNGEVIESLWEEFLARRTDVEKMPYIFSFSSESDSLSQWRAYTDTKDGGYAIGFRAKDIADAVDCQYAQRKECGKISYFMPCVYTSNVGLIRQIVQTGTAMLQECFGGDLGCLNEANNKHRAVDLMVLMSSFIKDKGFEAEQEWRVVVKADRVSTKTTKHNDMHELTKALSGAVSCCAENEKQAFPEVQILGGKPRIATGIQELKMGIPQLVEELWVSPHGDESKLMCLSNALRHISGLAFVVRERSRIPYKYR